MVAMVVVMMAMAVFASVITVPVIMMMMMMVMITLPVIPVPMVVMIAKNIAGHVNVFRLALVLSPRFLVFLGFRPAKTKAATPSTCTKTGIETSVEGAKLRRFHC